MKIRATLFCVFLFGHELSFAAAPVISTSVQASIRQRVDYGCNPGVAVGMANSSGRAFFSYGAREIGNADAITADTLFEIGSITKVFTATLLASLVQTGEASLTSAAQTYLPATVTMPARNGTAITLLHLATHASGLPYVPPNLDDAPPDNPFAEYTVEKLHEMLNTFSLPRDPGAGYEYSNVGVGLLGYALALRAGMNYEELLRERILDPLGLNDTRIVLSPAQATRRATGYSGVVSRTPFAMASLEGAGSLLSSINDLLSFLEYQSGLRASDLAPAFSNAVTTRRATDIPGVNIGLVWWILPISGDTIVFHEGDTMGQTSFFGYRKSTRTCVVVLTNARVNQYANVEDIGLTLLGVGSLTSLTKPATVPIETLRKYQGIYSMGDGTFFDIRLTNNFVTFSYSNASNLVTTLYPQTARQFIVLDPGINATAFFNTNATGRVLSMNWNQGSATTFTREMSPSALSIASNPAGELTLFGDSPTIYRLERTSDFVDWEAFSTNSIWTNRISTAPSGPLQFYRAVAP